MSFGPESLRRSPTDGLPGRIEYRLARNALVRELQRGRLSRRDVCDAHPELLRAARCVGQPAGEPCPVCEEDDLVHVTFAFGPRLPPGGRCLGSTAELAQLAARATQVYCYVVEVCPGCSWNHLLRQSVVGGRRRG